MDNLNLLKNYFFAATAESENTFLDEVFVTSKDFYKIIEPIPGTMRILVGNKGSGKSAVLERLLNGADRNGVPAIRITPANLVDLKFEENISPARIISIVRESVIKYMAIEYGKKMKGFLSEADNELFKQTSVNGVAQKTLIDRLIEKLKPIGKGITDIDFDLICGHETSTGSLKASIEKRLLKDDKVFYVLIDDIDQIASVERKDRNDIIWGVILAMFNIAQELCNVFPIITVRKEIWRQLTVDNGNRDKYDQIRNMIYNLEPTKEDMIQIVERRLSYCTQKNGIGNVRTNPYTYYFEGQDCKLPSTNERRTWSDYFISSSRGNPRDIIQLVNHLIVNAIDKERQRITDNDVEETSLKYSDERVSDLISQNKDFCTGLDHIIRSFSKENKFEFSAEEIRLHLSNAIGAGKVTINGKNVRSSDPDDIFRLWDVLSNIGFLNAQTIDIRQAKQYSFLKYDSSLIKTSRWNDIQKYTWHIHPCYRSFLIDIQKKDMYRKILKMDENRSNSPSQKKKKSRKKGR